MTRRVVVSGASGLIGTALVRALREVGTEVTTLVRRPARGAHEVPWAPGERPLDPGLIDGADAVVALGGASVGRMPWTSSYRAELTASRLGPTLALADAIRELGEGAPAFLSASAVGYYGSVPGAVLTEASPAGNTFLAGLCVEWERAARTAGPHSRVVLLRTAPVIHRDGVLKPMIRLTGLGLGGPLGRGTQVWPWISLDDEVRAIQHLIASEIEGPVNLTGPTPATANEQGRALARAMRRPFWLPAPEWGLRLALGRAATESLLTADADVRPSVLERSGFTFTSETVEAAVQAALAEGDRRG
ncbi:TIGR01777 family oxidoreductase [Leucobacter sp. W1038]|uniref:TIGR01777 family oxidoreductase n=1 Tax=Leucobacter sp. W1038 TaxID=3438281 RepID=UPI003D9980A9